MVRVARGERAAVEQRLAEASRDLADALDREIAAGLRTLAALGGSERLERGDIAGFADEAARVEATQPRWLAVLLFTPEGLRVVDTRTVGDVATEPTLDPESLRQAIESGRPTVSSLLRSGGGGPWAFALRMPVISGGRARWVLTAVIEADAIGEMVAVRPGADGEWTRTVVDRAGRIVARSRAPERFVGAPATPSFVASTGRAPAGVFRDVTLEGTRAYVAYGHGAVSGWTVAVVAEAATLDAPLRRSLLETIGIALALLALAGAGTVLLARRFSLAIESAALGAEALARGSSPDVDARGIAELARLGDALRRSADLLAARAKERDDLLARAEAARADAEAASRTKDEFLALLGHELRNPLSPIVTALHLLEQRGLAATKEHAIIRRQVAHLVRLVDDLLDVSRITRGKVVLHVEVVDVAAVVAKAVEMASDLLEQRRHRLDVEVPPGLAVTGDAVRLAQVFANLLTNAARYTPPGGQVKVRAARSGDRIRIEVQDDGRGLSPELLEVIFDPFVQGPRTPDRQEGGLGLGLTLVRTLVALHGGRVEAHSAGPGKGSTFAVELPAKGDVAALAPAPARPATAGTRRRAALRVLVVDDNADAAALLAEVVEGAGHEVRVAGDGPSALDVAATFAPEVAILDIGLPVMDGYELAARLRQRLGGAAPVVLGVTGYGQEQDHARSREAGFRRHLVKPVDPDVLLRELDAVAAERARVAAPSR